MIKRIIFILLMVLAISAININAESNSTSVFCGPYSYEDYTSIIYKYFDGTVNNNSNSSTRGLKTIDESRTVTISEKQTLTYWLHTPVHYDSNKSYPIMVYVPGSGCTIFEHENFETKAEVYTNSDEFLNSPYSKFYRQSVYYGPQFWICGYKDLNGNWIDSSTVPGNYNSNNAAFLEQWYDLVYNQGKDEYDCFIVYVQPEDEAWWENHSNLEALCIHTMAQSKEICEKYDDELLTYSSSQYNSGYIVDEISANPFSQLTVKLIDKLIKEYSIDSSRQYLSGFSLGAQFSFDTMCHYPNRFAAAVFSGLPASDVTENNAKRLTNMNIWTFSGSSDFCNKNFSLEFIKAVDSAKEKYGGIGEARSTVCSGGHSGTYLNGNQTYVSGDTFTKGSTDIIDFMFASKRIDKEQLENIETVKYIEKKDINAIASSAYNNKYDLVLIGASPLDDCDEYGFEISVNNSQKYNKVVNIKTNNHASKWITSLNGEKIELNSIDYGSVYVYAKTIKAIPVDVTSFYIRSWVKKDGEMIYSEPYIISKDGSSVIVTKVK